MEMNLDRYFSMRSWGKKYHRFQIGPLVFSNRYMAGNYLHMKLYKSYLNPETYPGFYKYHLKYFQSNCSESEQQFLKVMWETVNLGIWICKNHPHSLRAKKRLAKLVLFGEYLRSIDHWEISYTKDELVDLKTLQITNLQDELKKLKSQLSALKVDYKIKCPDKESIIDIILQIRDLENQEGNQIFKCPSQSTWAKIISNYFETNEPIPFDTALNYLRRKSIFRDSRVKIELKGWKES
jgi:hypothetical protein